MVRLTVGYLIDLHDFYLRGATRAACSQRGPYHLIVGNRARVDGGGLCFGDTHDLRLVPFWTRKSGRLYPFCGNIVL